MTKSRLKGVLACTGAVIGAGFASGREIVSFFSRYGVHAWWLLGISSAVMGLLCLLVLRRIPASEEDWCSLFAGEPHWLQMTVRFCSLGLMIVTGGAMISAGGHMIAMVWNHPWAYAVGAVGTLAAAWRTGMGKINRLSWLSAGLTAFFLGTAAAVWYFVPVSRTVQLPQAESASALWHAAADAVGYAAMNLTLAIGIINRSRQAEKKENVRMGICFGTLMLLLLAAGNALFDRFPDCQTSAFPMVWLLRQLGKAGYLTGAALLYLAILTTLTAVLYTIRTALGPVIGNPKLTACCTLGVPLAVSGIGFSGIVDSLYAPAGLACLLLIFVPLMCRSA